MPLNAADKLPAELQFDKLPLDLYPDKLPRALSSDGIEGVTYLGTAIYEGTYEAWTRHQPAQKVELHLDKLSRVLSSDSTEGMIHLGTAICEGTFEAWDSQQPNQKAQKPHFNISALLSTRNATSGSVCWICVRLSLPIVSRMLISYPGDSRWQNRASDTICNLMFYSRKVTALIRSLESATCHNLGSALL